MKIALLETQLGLRNSTTRLPFRYGKACLTRCPQAVLAATIQTESGQHVGYSGDCLPPGWFDKSPERSYAQQIDDMLAAIRCAEEVFRDEFTRAQPFFPGWLESYRRVQVAQSARGVKPLLASFGVSMVERAVMDAMCRAAGASLDQAVRSNLFQIMPGEVHSELAGCVPAEWLPVTPRTEIFVRHTVGLADPLTAADVPHEQRVNDGFPETLEEYLVQNGLQYLKVKVSNQLDRDLDRLKTIAVLLERHRGRDFTLTVDGNEQYPTAEAFDGLVQELQRDPLLAQLWQNVLAIEQPLERGVALDPQHTAGLRQLCELKPVIIDESDGQLESYARALEVGYRGVSSKNCKGPIKSLLNAGLTWQRNAAEPQRYLMTGEDLCTVGVVPVQSDLCLVAMLGLTHVERNGHHYHPGLSYLPAEQQQAAWHAHSDLYEQRGGRTVLRIVDGRLRIGSLQCAGFGFAVEPDLQAMQTPEQWEFSSLGLS